MDEETDTEQPVHFTLLGDNKAGLKPGVLALKFVLLTPEDMISTYWPGMTSTRAANLNTQQSLQELTCKAICMLTCVSQTEGEIQNDGHLCGKFGALFSPFFFELSYII